jgi:hypothetical protein
VSRWIDGAKGIALAASAPSNAQAAHAVLVVHSGHQWSRRHIKGACTQWKVRVVAACKAPRRHRGTCRHIDVHQPFVATRAHWQGTAPRGHRKVLRKPPSSHGRHIRMIRTSATHTPQRQMPSATVVTVVWQIDRRSLLTLPKASAAPARREAMVPPLIHARAQVRELCVLWR